MLPYKGSSQGEEANQKQPVKPAEQNIIAENAVYRDTMSETSVGEPEFQKEIRDQKKSELGGQLRDVESMHNKPYPSSNWNQEKFATAQSEHPKLKQNLDQGILEEDEGIEYGKGTRLDKTLLDDSMDSALSRQRRALIEEFNEDEARRKKCASCTTVSQYMVSESVKKPTDFKIGVFTVFIVVMFITMLKSVVDSAPILFVKIGQSSVGAIDVTLRAKDPALTLQTGNMNYYAVNPFNGLFNFNETAQQQDDPTPTEVENISEEEACYFWPNRDTSPIIALTTDINITVCPDHIQQTNQTSSLLRNDYYQETLSILDQFSGFVPRWYVPASNLASVEAPDFTSTQTLAIIDTEQEIEVGVGYDFPPLVVARGQIQVPQQLATYLGVGIGEDFFLYISNFFSSNEMGAVLENGMFQKLMASVAYQLDYRYSGATATFEKSDGYTLSLYDLALEDFTIRYTLTGTYGTANGKFNQVFGNVAIVDCNWFFLDLMDGLQESASQIEDPVQRLEYEALLQAIKLELQLHGFTACDFPFEIDGVLNDQASYYIQSYDEIVDSIDAQAEDVATAVGLTANVTITTPLKTQFRTSSQTQSYLQATLLTVVVFLAILSTMLLYSLMLSDVDAKTYEYAMLRALGFKKKHLVGVISLKSLSFSIPGLVFGVLCAFVLNIGLRMVIFMQAENYSVYTLTVDAILIGGIFGLITPMISNYLPIQSALGKNLRNSLDLSRRVKDELGIKVEKLEDVGISVNQLIVALILIVVGFSTYYLVPWAAFKGYTTLLFLLMNLVLVLVILGMTFICMLVFEYLERFILWCCMGTCCRKDRRLYTVISKNMEAHRTRNSKTSVMFTLAISYMIFSASSFLLLSTLIIKTAESLIGADISVSNVNGFLDEIPISNFLDTQLESAGGPVVGYAFMTPKLEDFYEQATNTDTDDTELYNLAEYAEASIDVYAVPENYMDVILSEYYIPTDMQEVSGVRTLSDGKIDAVGLLFSDEDVNEYPTVGTTDQDAYNVGVQTKDDYNVGPTYTIKMLLPSGMADIFSITAKSILRLIVQPVDDGTEVPYRVEARGLITKLPGVYFSGLNIVVTNLQGVISMDQYKDMMNDLYETNIAYEYIFLYNTQSYQFVDGIPKSYLWVRLTSDVTADQRTFVANGIRNFFQGQSNVILIRQEVVDSYQAVSKIFNLFTAIIAGISLFLAFFLLLISMTQNVDDASWEFGVLRSMGLTKAEGMRIYMYEAYLVVCSAAILGVIVGFVCASAVAIQFYSFIELPIELDFPWILFGVMVGLSLVTVFFAVWAPVKAINRRTVSSVLRGS